MEFTANEGHHPPPHERYLVNRGRIHFIATPCYGMHQPWWVAQTATGEVEPVPMEPNDRWVPLKQVIE